MTAGNLKAQMKCVPGGFRNMALVAGFCGESTGHLFPSIAPSRHRKDALDANAEVLGRRHGTPLPIDNWGA